MEERVNLYYAEKCSAIPGAAPDARFLTNEELMLSNVPRVEAARFIERFSHIRSVWRVEVIEPAVPSFQDQDDACGCGQPECDGRDHADAPLTAEEIEREESNQSPWANRLSVD